MSDNEHDPPLNRPGRDHSKRHGLSAVERDIDWVTREQSRRLAEEIVTAKFNQLYRDLGINVEDIKELRLFRDDLTYLRMSREANIDRKTTLSKTLITSIIGGVFGLIVSVAGWFVSTALHK